ncbi:MAG: GTPase HflX [Oscillospiraceae bacterium]|nr:GTPase HflX [Oscillospiraceae bacterium]
MIENNQEKPRVILVSVDTGEFDAERSMEELCALCDTAGAEVVATVIQKRPSIEGATCIGSGRLAELATQCEALEIDQLIFDRELTATQIRNIEDATDTFTIDRTMLILDIFAQRATTREGKLQVELAQHKYRLTRLTGMGVKLSRLGGGIGTRGPGETKLETDRRHIRSRISALEKDLKEVEQRRDITRKRRKKDGVLTAAIVGYTNAGKSTLLNALTDAGVLSEDKLFATLETTSRAILLPDGRSVTLIDTVGLISRLPHQLVEAFKSTLEEAASADLLIHLIDASSEYYEEEKHVTEELLHDLGCDGIPTLTVLNKCDLIPDITVQDSSIVCISAKNSIGLDSLLEGIVKALPETARRMTLLLPYTEAGLLSEIRKDGTVYSEEYTPDGIKADVLVDIKLCSNVENYRVDS